MNPDLFKNLPSEISINIFSRLPVRSIARSKCVCKPWLHLLRTDDFVNSHLSKSVPSFAFWIFEGLERETSSVYQVFEFEDEVDDIESHDFRSNQATRFSFPHKATMGGAANGLLLLEPLGPRVDVVYIVNPVTREYVVVPVPNEELLSQKPPRSWELAYGFGASRISRQHKVVRINDKSECYVYTLETGSWRRVAVEPGYVSLICSEIYFSAFVGGNLYWTVLSAASPTLVVCFDLETECFSSFDAPARLGDLSFLKDRLCFCECKPENNEIVLWLMKEKSWSKEYVIEKPHGYYCACPINVFKNGDILMLCRGSEFILFYNSNETRAVQEIAGIHGWRYSIFWKVFSLSFLSLKSLGMENVLSF